MFIEIKNFEHYSISKDGLVRSNLTGKLLKPFKKTTGYLMVHLYKEGRKYGRVIHRLLAETFIPNPENKYCVNHKDGNKLNNSLDNLEWCTYQENSRHAFDTGLNKHHNKGGQYLRTEEHRNRASKLRDYITHDIVQKMAKSKERRANWININSGEAVNNTSAKELSRKYGLNQGALSKVFRGVQKQHKGWAIIS